MKKVYAIGIGGSGAKCVESLLFLHSLGLLGETRLGTLLVDADASNGNGQRTGIVLKTVAQCQSAFQRGKTAFMRYPLQDYETWNPLGDATHAGNLGGIFNKQALGAQAPALAKVMDVLYGPAEQSADLDVGFRGRPPIGSAVMSRLDWEGLNRAQGGQWQKLLDNLLLETSSPGAVVVHLFGSVFGGTGAAGTPTLASLIDRKLREEDCRGQVRLNASLLLPYFGFERPDDGDQTVFAETRFFALNTQAALQYFAEQAEGVLDNVYLLGHQDKENYPSCTGGAEQKNGAHFAELYSALAVNHGAERKAPETQVFYISRGRFDRLTWSDLPQGETVKTALAKGVRFAYAWRYNFSLELAEARRLGGKRFFKGAPWFRHFFAIGAGSSGLPTVEGETQVQQAQLLDQWCGAFLNWCRQIAKANTQSEQFFHLQDLADSESEYREELEELAPLILDLEQSEDRRRGDHLDNLKFQLDNQGRRYDPGVSGLAHALFDLL
ncbi:MAG: hypothetical protein GC158_04640 [Cyanobacteria bacterium RI_101]|nr:hypothetical protein [Cyanobacteria bacterium RI_101]